MESSRTRPADAAPGRDAPPPAPGRRRPRILTFSNYYLPGYKGGGGIRTLSNMVERLGDELDFHLVTRDRDLGEDTPYPLPQGCWVPVGKARVWYLSPGAGPAAIRGIIRASGADVLYLNSFFAQRYTLLPLLARSGLPVVIAPRGEFSPGALALKWWKKRPYLALMRAAGVFSRVLWQVSSPHEEHDLRRWFGPEARVCVAPDLCGPVPELPGDPPEKRPGALRVVFLSRVDRKKNLDGALRMLAGLSGEVEVTVHGPLQDQEYWSRCLALAAELPPNVRFQFAGPVPAEEVHRVLRRHHVFLLPTLGENFGHAILEALLAGLPVVVSDQTPWTGLAESGVGADLPLGDPAAFTRILQRYVDMDAAGYHSVSDRARAYGVAHATDPQLVDLNRELFRRALSIR